MMQKKVVSLFLVVMMAVGMMLTLASCGKKSLEEYFEIAVDGRDADTGNCSEAAVRVSGHDR